MQTKGNSQKLLWLKPTIRERTASSQVRTSRWALSWVAWTGPAQTWKGKVESKLLKEFVSLTLKIPTRTIQDSMQTSIQDTRVFHLSMERKRRKRRVDRKDKPFLLNNSFKRLRWAKCKAMLEGTARAWMVNSLMQPREESHLLIKTQEEWEMSKVVVKAVLIMDMVSNKSRV